MFITTANMLDTVPGPLRDRMEIISLAGYTADEKLEIARRYLVQRQLEANGLKPGQVEIGDDVAARHHPELHARSRRAQSGARRSARRCAMPRCALPKAQSGPIRIAPRATSSPILGAPRFENEIGDAHERARRGDRPRLDAGRRRHPVHRGDAHSRLRPADPHRPARRRDEGERAGGAVASSRTAPSRSASIPRRFEKSDIHVHVPAGAIPKDGPSAGVAMFMALVSLMTDRTIRSDTAMTGEISLRGLVLPVGGIKEKVVAAHSRRHQARHAAGAQPPRLRRHSGDRAQGDGVRLARARRGSGRRGARAGEVRGEVAAECAAIGGRGGERSVTLRCSARSAEPRRATAAALGPHPSRLASLAPQDDGLLSVYQPQVSSPLRHGRACPGHPRLSCAAVLKTWMPATSAGMTRGLRFN